MAKSPRPLENSDFKKHLVDGETTPEHLTEVLHKTETDFKPLPGFSDKDDGTYNRLQAIVDCDEACPNVYIGDAGTAKNRRYLKMLGVTHLLNAAEGNRFGFVDTDESYYKGTGIKYMGLPLADLPSTYITKYFHAAADFIDEAVTTGGKAFVHCQMGMSRSATCVLAYLMIKKEMLAADAIRTVRNNRDIVPNEGFLRQLAELDNQLRRQRL